MAFQLSPGVNVSEIDLTTVVPSVATSDGAFAGIFRWGPVGQRFLVESESQMVSKYGKPSNLNAETFFTAANFLSYSNRLYLVRAANTSGSTPVVTVNATSNSSVVLCSNTSAVNVGMYITQISNTAFASLTGNTNYVTAVNATSITFSKPAPSSGNTDLYLGRPGTTYSAVGLLANGLVANLVNQIVANENSYAALDGNFDSDVTYVARYPGGIGNSLRVSVCDSVNAFSSNINLGAPTITYNIGSNSAQAVYGTSSNASATAAAASFTIGDNILAGNSTMGYQYLTITAVNTSTNSTNTFVNFGFQDPYRLFASYSTNTVQRFWEFHNIISTAPGQSTYQIAYGNTAASDELHVVVVDDGGLFTGTPGQILESYRGISRATDSKNADGSTNYYKTVINQDSKYVWWTNDSTTAVSNNSLNLTSSSATAPGYYQFALGNDGVSESNTSAYSLIASAYNLFASPEDVDISLVLQGKPLGGPGTSYQLGNFLIDNIAEVRKDCVAFISPDSSNVLNNTGNEALSLVSWRNSLRSSSYAVIDSGYKYQYDRYNDIYRWIPLNGDIAGLCARTDQTNDAWWSPAGFNRGQIKNSVKLAYNPSQPDRDILYSNGINPVVTFQGQGTILYGDKTAQAKPSAFDRINVRRLFIVLEKAIARAAKYSLFEFNDNFTRSQFKNLVNPYLRTIQGRRGITDFKVVCDDTNNTPAVIDANQFVGDIYIKPARSINFIQLNFVAVGTGVQFSEVVGKF
jgi:hypothetical protein